MRVALVQVEARDDVADNLARAAAMAAEAAVDGRPRDPPRVRPVPRLRRGFPRLCRARPRAHHRAVRRPSRASTAAGSSRQPRGGLGDPDRPYNTAVLFDRSGALAARTASSTCSTSPWTTARPTPSRPGSRPAIEAVVASVDGVGLGPVDLLRPALPRAVPRAGRGGREAARRPGGVHRAHRARPLGGAPARPGHRERRLGLAAGGCGRGGPGAIPAWGHSMVVDPGGA